MDKTRVKEDKEKQEEVTGSTAASTGNEQSDNVKEKVDEPQMENAGDPAAENEMIKLKDEIAGARDKYIRLYSEFENFRRRTAKGRSRSGSPEPKGGEPFWMSRTRPVRVGYRPTIYPGSSIS